MAGLTVARPERYDAFRWASKENEVIEPGSSEQWELVGVAGPGLPNPYLYGRLNAAHRDGDSSLIHAVKLLTEKIEHLINYGVPGTA